MGLDRYDISFNYSVNKLTRQLQALHKNYYIDKGSRRDYSDDMNFYEFIDTLNQREFTPTFKIPTDKIDLPAELKFLQNTFFHSLAESQNAVVWEFEDPSERHCILRIGGDGLDENGARLNCPLILPTLGLFDLASYRTEIVPCVQMISAGIPELEQFLRRLDILPAMLSDDQMKQFMETSATKYLNYHGPNTLFFESIVNNLLDGTPWQVMNFLDIGMLPTGLPIFADPGHIELREGAVDPKLGSPEYQAALGKMYENQKTMKLPKELSWVRKDEQGLFHAVVRDHYFPPKLAANPVGVPTAAL